MSSSMDVDQSAWTIGALLDWTAAYLAKKGIEFPRLDAEVLLAHALGARRIDLYTRHQELAPEAVRNAYRELIRQRLAGCPVAYLVGHKEFFSLSFEVNRAVLIPRPDSEHVVIECLRLAQAVPEPRILDLGTGSGNLAVTLAKHLAGARVVAVDHSGEALAVARRNAERHGVADRIQFLEGDLFEPLAPADRFHFVISNPPYIPTAEIANLAVGVRDFEPHLALDGGSNGFAVLERILAGAAAVLEPGGWLIVEIGAPQHLQARKMFGSFAAYRLAETVYDGSRHPRVLCAQRV